ncbi:hypothetical protein EIN_108540 [Entamoeba invadens IP1]|uniref:TLDc domain-containing protein n=1 Tax=Entamoeba invadens IP1 TaxID=370355 RepID=L7FNX8_ENTIV|nr:hypothetical protein EIN_108540 [Entamoeba invadens IP1]ELP94692.1 hypothetical protein EIN_108540 [Entamoeba invadens IP1]|eukprot:XP_004261463.1 hypothetical protein EIN_108540 [Entamoeba invadens IP1]
MENAINFIDEITLQYNTWFDDYTSSLTDTKFKDDLSQTLADRLRLAETAFDISDEHFNLKIAFYKNSHLFLQKLENFVELFSHKISDFFDFQKIATDEHFDTISDVLLKLYKEMDATQTDTHDSSRSQSNISELLKITEQRKREVKSIYLGCSSEEVSAIESMTSKSMSEVLFDSTRDDWSVTTSVFNCKIMFKNNLVFLIEDDKQNIFGGVFYDQIDMETHYINSSTSFLFSIIRNGIFKPKKFDLIGGKNKEAFVLCSKESKWLFVFGNSKSKEYGDIGVTKRGVDGCCCVQQDYTAKFGELVDGRHFNIKRIRIIKLLLN